MLKRSSCNSLLLAAALTAVYCQPVLAAPPSGTLNYTYFTPANVEDGPDSEVTQQDLRLTLPAGFYGKPEDGAVIIKVNLAERQFSMNHSGRSDEVLRVYDISVPVRYMKKLNDERSFSAGGIPSLNSSMEHLQSDDFTFSAYGQHSWKLENHNYSLGLLYGRLLGADRLIPIGGYSYTGKENLELTLGFPATGVRYYPQKSYSYFAGFFPYGGSWHVYDDGDSDRDYYLRQTGYRFGGGVTFDIGGPWQLQFEAGQQFAQQLEIDESDGFDSEIDIENSTYVGISLNLKAPSPGDNK